MHHGCRKEHSMLKIIFWLIVSLVGLAVLSIVGLQLYMGPDPISLKPDQVLSGVKIQPAEAIRLAEVHLNKRKVKNFNNLPVKLYIFRRKGWFSDWYYVNRSAYPAKTLRSYIRSAVKVHPQTGEIELPQK